MGNGICAENAGGRVEPAVRGSHAEGGVCGLSFRHGVAGTKEEKASVITGHGKEVELMERRVSEVAGVGRTSRGIRCRQPDLGKNS